MITAPRRPTPWALDGAGNPLVPPSVLAELKDINPRLGLQYHPMQRFFAVTLQWPEGDPRREMIRDGVLPEDSDFEILAPVPADVPLDELRGWLAGQLRRVGKTRADIAQMVAEEEQKIAAQNAAREKEIAAQVFEEAMTMSTKNIDVGRRRTKVPVPKVTT